jgi:methylmalonyl-CoA mutase C-terminal domain/subunit
MCSKRYLAGGLLSKELEMNTRKKPIKVLLSRSMLDCHQRGLIAVAAALRDAGMEVVYTRFLMPEEVVKTAVEEDVDVIGLSFLAWGQMHLTAEVMRQLKERNIDNMLVLVGGVIRDEQVPKLEEMGVARVFGAGSATADIVEYIKSQKG